MIVTIDGPAGAGKSSVARKLARKLGFQFLDSGAMYRALTLAGIRAKINLADETAFAQLATEVTLRLNGNLCFLNEENVSTAIRTVEITEQTQHAANNLAIRSHLVTLQREIGHRYDTVSEGRDQATVVFPNAECKIYLTASEEERARRRHRQLTDQGDPSSYQEVLATQQARDDRDMNRKVGALKIAPDSIKFLSDGMTQDEVLLALYDLVLRKKP